MDSYLQEKTGQSQGSHPHRPPASNSDLMSSAKLVAEAAKATFSHESEKVDKGRVAGAAANLLDAASHYGKLEEKSYGKYVHKAETYLHGYQSSHSSNTTSTAHSNSTTTGAAHHPASGHSGEHGGKKEEGGLGDYMKMAQGFMGSGHSGEHGGKKDEGGIGDYMKMAQGFLKK